MTLPDRIPLDTNHPAVREYLLLVRLQVLTPLSLLINIATFVVATFVVSPGISKISNMHLTPISPSPTLVGINVVIIFAAQIGYCLLLVLASKEETKQALIKGVGFSLVIANWVMAFWAVTWVLQLFVPSTILLVLLTLTLLYSNIVLLIYHSPKRSRPFDTLLIHVPMRLFLLLPATLLLPQSIFIMLNKTWDPKDAADHYRDYEWEGFAVVMATNVVGLLIVAIRRDIVWCFAAVWINISIWSKRPKSPAVQATAIVFTVLQPITLVVAAVWNALRSPQEHTGPIALPADEEQNQPTPHSNMDRTWGECGVDGVLI